MKKASLKLGALVGGITSLPVAALLYLGSQLADLPFVPFDVFDWLARALPGDIITAGIDTIVGLIALFNLGNTSQSAKIIEQIMAILIFILGGALFGIIVAWAIESKSRTNTLSGAFVGFFAYLFVLMIELLLVGLNQSFTGLIWLAIIFIGWGIVLSGVLVRLTSIAQNDGPADVVSIGRRDMLIRLAASSAGIALGAWGFGRLVITPEQDIGASVPLAEPSPIPPSNTVTKEATKVPSHQTPVASTREKVAPAPGTRPELTSNEDFYRIDINTRPPTISKDDWLLEVEGLFDDPRDLSLKELMSFPTITQTITLSCISNRIGGDLIGTSNWTGLRLRELLAHLGLKPEASSLLVEATDGFHETVTMQDMLDPRTLLVYGMNGETLPVEHGFPLRIYIPNRYGMKQPKWIKRISAVDDDPLGYWVKRGWSKEAIPQIVSVVDTIDVDEPTNAGLIPIGGIAWAGDRGISNVEIQVDDGEWVKAELRTPTLSPLTWVQWRYNWEAIQGSHNIKVRATDGLGQRQIVEESSQRPNGATGFHSVTIRI